MKLTMNRITQGEDEVIIKYHEINEQIGTGGIAEDKRIRGWSDVSFTAGGYSLSGKRGRGYLCLSGKTGIQGADEPSDGGGVL